MVHICIHHTKIWYLFNSIAIISIWNCVFEASREHINVLLPLLAFILKFLNFRYECALQYFLIYFINLVHIRHHIPNSRLFRFPYDPESVLLHFVRLCNYNVCHNVPTLRARVHCQFIFIKLHAVRCHTAAIKNETKERAHIYGRNVCS